MRKNPFTRKHVDKIKAATTKCFNQATKEILKNRQGFTPAAEKPLVDERYRVLICQLETKMLEDILNAHYTEQVRRAPITLDAIRTELASRVLLK